jgi:aminodeoxyfutalosine deaminase
MSERAMTVDADWIETMDGPTIRKGRVLVEAGRIAAIGPADRVPIRGRHRRLGHVLLLPGLVNAHCHLELSAYHGMMRASDLWSWLTQLVELRLAPGGAAREQAALTGAVRSMLAAGTTCVGDISRAEWLAGALAKEPIRKVCYVELISGARSSPADMAQLRQRLSDLPSDDPLLLKALSPHSPYTVTREDLEACMALAASENLPLAIHVAETREETRWLHEGTGSIAQWQARLFKAPPRSPLIGPTAYILGAHPARPSPTALVHMNYADDWRSLLSIPADRRPVVVYCPRSHAFFGHQPHPFREMLEAGLLVATGTDSAASHAADERQPLSVLDELRWLYRQQPDLPAMALLRMGTVHAGAAVGLGQAVGRIRVGFAADLVAFSLEPMPSAEPLAAVLKGTMQPCFVCVAGQVFDLATSGTRAL